VEALRQALEGLSPGVRRRAFASVQRERWEKAGWLPMLRPDEVYATCGALLVVVRPQVLRGEVVQWWHIRDVRAVRAAGTTYTRSLAWSLALRALEKLLERTAASRRYTQRKTREAA
jgi:hypothetical protein